MILLREKRLEKELSQKELAELSGVPQQNISAYEAGARTPGADALYALAKALGTTMDELYRPDRAEELEGQIRMEDVERETGADAPDIEGGQTHGRKAV